MVIPDGLAVLRRPIVRQTTAAYMKAGGRYGRYENYGRYGCYGDYGSYGDYGNDKHQKISPVHVNGADLI